MKSFKGKTALITGASSGIGKALAEALAKRGARVIITARSEAGLNAVAEGLRAARAPLVEVIALDLAAPGGAAKLAEAVKAKGLEVDLLVNNAGFGKWGEFVSVDAATDAEMVQLNITALVELCHLFLPPMIARGDGGIINVASVAAFTPVPWAAVYSATKSFVLNFSEALFAEYEDRGVHVLALCPGGTQSNFAAVASNTPGAAAPGLDTAESVAEAGLKAFLSKRTYLITGKGNGRVAMLPRLLSRKRVARMVGNIWKGVLAGRGAAGA
jgi:short-subunit dehydrogenase